MMNVYICASNNSRIPDEEQPSYCINFVVAKNRYYARKLFREHNNLDYEEKITCQRLGTSILHLPQILSGVHEMWDDKSIDWDNVYYGLPTRSGWSELGYSLYY